MTRLLPTSALAIALLALMACGESEPLDSDTTVPGLELADDESLLVIGDWGTGTESQREVAARMEEFSRETPVAAIVTTGDNFYSDNADELMEPFRWATEGGIPFLISWGNHDIESERRIELIDEIFGDPPRWWMHEWGQVDILILDSTRLDSHLQSRFLVTAMADDDPMIVVFHHPPLSCGSHGDSTEALAEWVPLFDDDVLLVLGGHEHNYQRFESDDITYVVSGGGGRSLTELADCSDDHPERIAGEADHHFVALDLTDSLSVTAINLGGDVIDEFTLPLDQ